MKPSKPPTLSVLDGLTRLVLPPALIVCVIVVATEVDPALVLLAPPMILAVRFLLRVHRGLPSVLLRSGSQGAVRRLRAVLAPDETLLGNGIVVAPRVGGEAFRLIACTDRRVLVASTNRAGRFSLLVDAPYERVRGFGIDWTRRGRSGALTLTVAGHSHGVDPLAPQNLLAIARALDASGVPADDPAVLAGPPGLLLDRAAMTTPGFDRGLWLMLAATAVLVYLDPLPRVPALLALAAVAIGCGYQAGTRSSVAYLVPVNVLLSPGFLFVDPYDVVVVMLLVSGGGGAGLLSGAALRRRPVARGGRGSALRVFEVSRVALLAVAAVVVVTGQLGVNLKWAVDEALAKQLPVDGRSDLTGGAASFTYTPGRGLRELVTDENWGAGPNDGARWELRSSFAAGDSFVSLSHYVFDDPRLDDPASVAKFVAGKDAEHRRMAGFDVSHTERVVGGRTGYVWEHPTRRGYWAHAEWFPHPVHTIRLECVARDQLDRFQRLCAEASGSLAFH